jgi:hypothetical protein
MGTPAPIAATTATACSKVVTEEESKDLLRAVHLKGAVSLDACFAASPTDRNDWPELERYTKDMTGTFGRDRSVVIWDLYNEPGNSKMNDKSLPLAEAVFAWARATQPRQPLTMGVWNDLNSAMSRRIMELSDVISFHGYDALPGVQDKLEICRRFGRPILCTEWLHRPNSNTVEAILPVFQAQDVGCYTASLVFGRLQAYMPWNSKPNTPVPAVWQHDLLRPDGAPFRAAEVELIRDLVKRNKDRKRRHPAP